MLELFINVWDVAKMKIQILINKVNKQSLDKGFVKELLAEFEVCRFIDYNQKHDYCLNNGVPFVIKAIEKETEDFRKIVENFNLVEKRRFLDKLFSKKAKVDEKIVEDRGVSHVD